MPLSNNVEKYINKNYALKSKPNKIYKGLTFNKKVDNINITTLSSFTDSLDVAWKFCMTPLDRKKTMYGAIFEIENVKSKDVFADLRSARNIKKSKIELENKLVEKSIKKFLQELTNNINNSGINSSSSTSSREIDYIPGFYNYGQNSIFKNNCLKIPNENVPLKSKQREIILKPGNYKIKLLIERRFCVETV